VGIFSAIQGTYMRHNPHSSYINQSSNLVYRWNPRASSSRSCCQAWASSVGLGPAAPSLAFGGYKGRKKYESFLIYIIMKRITLESPIIAVDIGCCTKEEKYESLIYIRMKRITCELPIICFWWVQRKKKYESFLIYIRMTRKRITSPIILVAVGGTREEKYESFLIYIRMKRMVMASATSAAEN
jgi:hypothetical protein